MYICECTDSMSDHYSQLWHIITQTDNPSATQLNTVFAIAFADLKKYTFLHWFSFPAFIAKPPWTLQAPWASLDTAFAESDVSVPIIRRVSTWQHACLMPVSAHRLSMPYRLHSPTTCRQLTRMRTQRVCCERRMMAIKLQPFLKQLFSSPTSRERR